MNGTKQLLRIAAAIEALTGFVAIVSPSWLVWLLWAIPLTFGGQIVGRLAGFALASLAVACWPSTDLRADIAPLRGLLLYNGLATVLFIVVAFLGPFFGVLFWPALVFHAAITVLLFRAWWYSRRAMFTA